ncbi:MAG: hypothetical protein H7336_09085 [Bacteriovorax sp.]|nr:hypothetical protein [Bacteriovorax sp.]
MKILNLKALFILAVLFSSQVIATEAQNKSEAKKIMDGVYGAFIKIIPYVYSDEKKLENLRQDASQKNNLLKNLTDISGFFKTARHVEYFQRPGFRPSLDTINKHIDETVSAVKNNNYIFAQKRMKALTSLCISCHSQLSETATENAFGNAISKAKKESFESDYAYGNYLFLVRRFGESEKFFDLATVTALKTGNDQELYSSLRRIISIHTKINFNPLMAQAFITRYQSNKGLPLMAQDQLEIWSKSLKKWKSFNPKKVKSIDSFIQKYLAPLEVNKDKIATGDNDIALLVSSGVLSKYLNDNPKSKNVPEILYWLSIAERRLSNSFFFSLSDLYLKDCVRLYPKSSYAKKCYQEYADNIEFGYSGSGGTDIPIEEKQELDALKGALK